MGRGAQSEATRASYEWRLNSKQIMRFRIDIECAAAQGSSTTTTTWDSRPRDRCDSRAEKDHDGKGGKGGANQASAASNTLEGI